MASTNPESRNHDFVCLHFKKTLCFPFCIATLKKQIFGIQYSQIQDWLFASDEKDKKYFSIIFRLSPIDQIDTLISGVEYNKNNSSVTKATALMNIWLIKQNGTKIDNQDLKDERAMDWESVFIQQVIVNASYNLPLNLTFDGLADRR